MHLYVENCGSVLLTRTLVDNQYGLLKLIDKSEIDAWCDQHRSIVTLNQRCWEANTYVLIVNAPIQEEAAASALNVFSGTSVEWKPKPFVMDAARQPSRYSTIGNFSVSIPLQNVLFTIQRFITNQSISRGSIQALDDLVSRLTLHKRGRDNDDDGGGYDGGVRKFLRNRSLFPSGLWLATHRV